MTIDFITIKQTFGNLSKLKVKEVILPCEEYDMLRDQVVLHCDDGGSWNYQRRLVEPETTMFIFGVRVKRELIVERQKVLDELTKQAQDLDMGY